ncbi:ras GTPase activating protein RasGAP/neurofibromin [Scheffersomyces coipomensis]|uniref:ras GTPase activating protein RasGAP/neurofibromin n=1 Tax=Scheffersomyces coipomensis TaxID=1788519 RepID=UPI00315CFB76
MEDSNIDNRRAFIETLITRVQSLLPNRTGHPLTEVELNPQFIVAKKILLENQTKHESIVTFIILTFVNHLIAINDEANGVKLKDRDEKSVASTLIIVKLLSEILKSNWNREKTLYNYDHNDLVSNYSRFYYYEPPSPIDPAIINHLLSTFMNLLSLGVVKRVLAIVKPDLEESKDDSSNPSSSLSNNSPLSQQLNQQSIDTELINNHIDEIDNHIEVILRYIASANPDHYYEFIHAKIFKYSTNDEFIPIPILQKYSPMIKFMFFSHENSERIAADIIKALPFIKSISWKQIFYVFLSTSIKDQTFSRSQDYTSIITLSNPEFLKVVQNLFDHASSVFDDNITSLACTAFTLTWLVILCLDDFVELEADKPLNKLKITFNKRLKFLVSVLKDTSMSTNLESFDSLINMYHLAARLKTSGYTDHPVYKFGLRYLETTHINLVKYGQSHAAQLSSDEALFTKYDYLVVNYYIAASMLKPDKFNNIIFQNYQSHQDNIREVRILVKILKGLSELEKAKDLFHDIMLKLAIPLRITIFGSIKILKQYDYERNQHNPLLSSSSSAASLYSDILSVESGQLFSFPSEFPLTKKTSLDHYLQDISPSSTSISNTIDSQIDDSFNAPSNNNNNSSVNPVSHHSHLHNHQASNSSSNSTTTHSLSRHRLKLVATTQEILADAFHVFTAAPELYFNEAELMNDFNLQSRNYDELIQKILQFCQEACIPFKVAFRSKQDDSKLFDAGCLLAMILVDENTLIVKNHTTLSTFANYTISNYIIQTICESCLSLSLIDSKFKACFLFINDFLQRRDVFSPIILSNKIITDPATSKYFEVGGGVIHSIEKILLLSLCTHDIQFYNIAKTTMRWYCNEINNQSQIYKNNGQEIDENLLETFERIINDDSVFTGFVSLHKRFRSILRDAKPTKSLYQVWLVIYNRWLELLDNKDESLVFKHYTGFLVSTSGCFLSTQFSNNDPVQKEKSLNYISEFFDKCIGLLTFHDLGIRLVVTDALSNESHSDVYHLISSKLMHVANGYAEKKIINDESVLYIEQALVIITNMMTIKNDGAFLLASLLPNICQFFIKFINLLDDLKDMLRLKLKFCRLGITLETERERVGLRGAFKLRNIYAKASAEWLEGAVFFEELREEEGLSSGVHSETASSVKSTSNESEIYLMDLAVLSSKCLSLQLDEIVLEVPDGTKDSEIRKYKDLAFGNYFSLFYKIIQKYSAVNTGSNKSKHKINQIIENILKSVSNILKYDTDIGMQFVLPMGYHPNKKIRSIFLSVFSYMLASRKSKKSKEEYPDHIIQKLSEITEIYGAVAEVASSTEHSLFSSSLFGIFGYTKKLDDLFTVLLNEEFSNVTRSSDIFRSNSTLTRLLSNFVKDYGNDYLLTTLKPFVQELVDNDIVCQVEKADTSEADTKMFMKYFNKLVDIITSSNDNIPSSFKFICSEIYKCVEKKFTDAALVAVGSFLFLRFICPAIVSPEVFLDITVTNPKVRKTLIQLTKVLQNIANGSLSSLKLPGLSSCTEEINSANIKIFEFMKYVSTQESSVYPFESINNKPVSELRYLHKFIYTYFINIKVQYLTTTSNVTNLHDRIRMFKIFDCIAQELGYPKPSVQLQINAPNKNSDPNNISTNQYNDFMTKMSMTYNDKSIDSNIIHNSIFSDGTPVVVLNFKQLQRQLNYDMYYLVYKLFETASQIWENKFYFVLDFTELVIKDDLDKLYVQLVSTYAPEQLFRNCARIYYFNIPRTGYLRITDSMKSLRKIGAEYGTKIYTYSQADSPDIIHSLCLDADSVSIVRDTKVVFSHVKAYDEESKTYSPVNVRIGRKWFQVCSEDRVIFKGSACVTDSFVPVEIYRLSEFSKCEVTNYTGYADEFTIFLKFGHKITFRSHERSEILRFIYFTTSRLTKEMKSIEDKTGEREHNMHWFGRLYNIVFQGLLCSDDEVRASASLLFGALSTYFEIDFGIDCHHAKSIAFPANTTQFVVSVSSHLAKNLPTLSYRFFKAFFDNYEKLPEENKLSSIIYVSPWISNIYEYIYLENENNGAARLAELVRLFCRISALNKDYIAFLNDYIWKTLFAETRLISVLVDEVVAYAVDNKNDADWSFIIATISPSIEVSGEVVSRLISCVNKAKKNESSIVSQSRLFEIKVLVKICSSLFFNSFTLARLYVADIFFFCTLFIDNVYLEFGPDLQKLVINIIQSFLHKPELTPEQEKVVDDTINYFSSQRAKMLFGMTRDITSSAVDVGQIYNRATNFEILCDYLNDFILAIGSTDDTKVWRARWCSYTIDVAFSKESLFQSRGILVYGILAKSGINDSTACRGLKLIANGDVSTLEYTTSISIATARVIQGLPETSILPPILVWPQFCFGLMNYSVLYQPSIQCLVNCLVKIIEVGQDYIDKAFEQRLYLEPYISDFERSYKFEITKQNFGVHIFFVLTQGLRISHFKHTSLTCLKQYFSIRYKYKDRNEIEGKYVQTNALAYLVFIYLSSDDSDFEAFIQELGIHTEYVTITNGRIPKIVIDFFAQQSDPSMVTLIHAAYFVESKSVDSVFKTKFLHVYDYIFRRYPEVGLLVYHILKPALEHSFLTSTSTDLVETISKIMISVFSSDTYSAAQYKAKVDEILGSSKITIIKENRKMRTPEGFHTGNAFENTVSADLKKLQMMLYRSACLFVEGSRLED